MRAKQAKRKKAAKKKAAGKKKAAEEARCPLCDLMGLFERTSCECLDVFKQTRIEFLKAIRTLVDKRIEDLEKGGEGRKKGGRVRKIEVEG